MAVLTALPMSKAEAQNWGVGLVGGYPSGIQVKKYMGANNLDFRAGWYPYSVQVAGLYEWNYGLGSGFTLYYGVGAGLGVRDQGFKLDINGILGVEWQIPGVPLALSLDWKPAFQLMPKTEPDAACFAFGIKYLF